MGFSKTCPLCLQSFSSLAIYMSHIKSNHSKISPEAFVKDNNELKWSFKQND
ncbi:MAG: hypothetical protein ACE5DT_00600 [Nitrosopumilus sp.]